MSLLVILIIVLFFVGGGNFFVPVGPYRTGGYGLTILILVLVILAAVGVLRI